MPTLTLTRVLIGSILAAAVAVGGYMMSAIGTPAADMRLDPAGGTHVIGEPFSITVVVNAALPVNVFAGTVLFDATKLQVERIEYNTDTADLWAEEPWFSNGDGTVTFAGGTTKPGGFTGEATLLTVFFETVDTGSASIGISNARILAHDGLGTDVPVPPSIDAIFLIAPETLQRETVVNKSILGSTVSIIPEPPQTDLNDDGKQTMADLSIFMQYFATQNLRGDYNADGRITTADMSIFLEAY